MNYLAKPEYRLELAAVDEEIQENRVSLRGNWVPQTYLIPILGLPLSLHFGLKKTCNKQKGVAKENGCTPPPTPWAFHRKLVPCRDQYIRKSDSRSGGLGNSAWALETTWLTLTNSKEHGGPSCFVIRRNTDMKWTLWSLSPMSLPWRKHTQGATIWEACLVSLSAEQSNHKGNIIGDALFHQGRPDVCTDPLFSGSC